MSMRLRQTVAVLAAILILLFPLFRPLPSVSGAERIVVFGEYPVVLELGSGRFGGEEGKTPAVPFIEYGKGSGYREKAMIEARHFLDAGVYGYTFAYRPGSSLMKTEESFTLELKGNVPREAARQIGEGVEENVYRVKLGFDPTPSVSAWRSAFRTNTIRLTDAEGTSEFAMGWEGRSDAYRDALKNLVLVAARIRLSSRPLLMKGDILIEGNPVFSVGAGRYYCRLQGYVNFIEIVTYD